MRDLFAISKVGVISSADAGSTGYRSLCWLGSIVDSLWIHFLEEQSSVLQYQVLLGVENLRLLKDLFTEVK